MKDITTIATAKAISTSFEDTVKAEYTAVQRINERMERKIIPLMMAIVAPLGFNFKEKETARFSPATAQTYTNEKIRPMLIQNIKFLGGSKTSKPPPTARVIRTIAVKENPSIINTIFDLFERSSIY